MRCARFVVVWLGCVAACTPKQQATSALDGGNCTLCHTNITNAHPNALVACTSCHGQNDLTDATARDALAAEFARTTPAYGAPLYQMLLDATHVPARDPKFFLANGQSSSHGACFNGATDPACNGGDARALGSVDDAVDSEYARDINYVRFVNPGDLRVAHASCGGGSPQAGGFGGCHAEEVVRVRRSMMTTNGSVVTAAFLGNRGKLQAGDAIDPRGYMFDLEGAHGVDSCWRVADNRFDRDCLDDPARRAYPADDALSAAMPGNEPGAFEAYPGPIAERAEGSGSTLAHSGHAPRLAGFGGQPLDGTSTPAALLQPPDNRPLSSLIDAASVCASVAATAVEPVDAILRGFRAYYPSWLPGTGKNFEAVGGATLDTRATGIVAARAANPFGRGHASGCTGCHMLYDNDGHNHEADQLGGHGDPTLAEAARAPTTALATGGMNVAQEVDASSPKQQRFYPARHQLTTRIPSRQCGLCHTFVTRIDLSYQGMAEVEERDVLARAVPAFPQSGDLTFTTPGGTKVRIFDNQARLEGKSDATDPRAAMLRSALADACSARGLDCDGLAIFSADLNDNGELDADEPHLLGDELLLPDRVPRELSVDGRQARLLYGGKNGSTHLKDVHLQKGMHCVDCHFYQDVHGDGNLYVNNWDTVEIECEDCHGFAATRAFDQSPGKLLTSGPNGRNDLMQARDQLGRAFFSVRDGQLFQRSRVNPDVEWQVPQLADEKSGDAHSDAHLPTAPGAGGKLECYTCHNAFAMNCLSCHYEQNFNQSARQAQEVFLTGGTQSSHTNFQLFGMIRGPLILGVDGTAEHNRISPFRSSMEAFVSLADCSGNTVAADVVHSNCRGGRPQSGAGMNNFMPHSVRSDVVRGCETCHSATNGQGHLVNNHILAQTMGLGTGRLDDVGDWLFVASSGDAQPSALDIVDIKDESELAGGETGARNSFPGFVVGNRADDPATPDARALLRSFAVAPAADPNYAPVDVALVRSFNADLCAGERPLNPDIALVAAGAGGLQIFDVSAPDRRNDQRGNPLFTSGVAVAAGNIVAVDHAGPDISDPFVYAADATTGFVTVDLAGFDPAALANASTVIAPAQLHAAAGWPAGVGALGVKLMGTSAVVGAGTSGLVIVDVSDARAPRVVGAPLPLCFAGEPSPCVRAAGRVTAQGTLAFVAASDGLVIVDVSAPSTPRLLSKLALPAPAEDVALSGPLAFVADGTVGLQIVDVTDAAAPLVLTAQPAMPIAAAHGVVMGTVPTQTWAFVAAGPDGVAAVNVSTLFDPLRGRAGAAAAAIDPSHVALTLEARDPFAPRDTTVAVDALPVVRFATAGSARAVARGMKLDRIADESGRRLRDSWNPGNGVLSRATMDAMRGTIVAAPAGP